jgi:hypothetical protein
LTAAPVSASPALQSPAIGKVKDNAGVGASFRPLPNQPGKSACILLRHIRQEPYLCVTTSATMVLAYDGVKTTPRELKALSDGRIYNPDQPFHYNKFTYFYQLTKGVASLGCAWRFGSFPLTDEGFRIGMAQLKSALDRGNPPLVDTNLYGDHTIVICGYDEAAAELLIMDPNIPHPGLRMLTDAQFERVWNSDGVNCHYRAAVFTSGKPEDHDQKNSAPAKSHTTSVRKTPSP